MHLGKVPNVVWGWLPRRPANSRRARRLYQRSRYWRCRMFPLARVYRASNPPMFMVNVHGGLRGINIAVTPILQPPQYTASPVQTSRPTKSWFRWKGTSHVPYGKMAFAGTGRATFPTKGWLRRNGTSHVPYE